MATHKELDHIPIEDGRYRFCLDRVTRDDQANETEYAFIWRGTSVSPDGFIQRPAYFTWEMLGKIIRQALHNSEIEDFEKDRFLRALFEIE